MDPSLTYSYYVTAYDAQGNESDPGNTVIIEPNRGEVTPGDGATTETVSVTVLPDITVTYPDTDCDGTTTVTRQAISVVPPAGIEFVGDEFEVDHDPGAPCANFPIIVAINYDPADITNGNESSLKMYHNEDGLPGQEDVTLYVDTDNNVIVGRLTSLSPVDTGIPAAPATGLNTMVLALLSFLLIGGGAGALVGNRRKADFTTL